MLGEAYQTGSSSTLPVQKAATACYFPFSVSSAPGLLLLLD